MTDKRKDAIGHLQIIHTWASFALEKGLVGHFTMKNFEQIMDWTMEALSVLERRTEWNRLTKRTFPPEGRVLLWLDAGRPCGGFPAVGISKNNILWHLAADKDGYMIERVVERPEWRYTRWAAIEPPEEDRHSEMTL